MMARKAITHSKKEPGARDVSWTAEKSEKDVAGGWLRKDLGMPQRMYVVVNLMTVAVVGQGCTRGQQRRRWHRSFST